MNTMLRFLKDEEGASMAEYALLLGLITVAAATVITTLGSNVKTAVSNANSAFQ